MLWEHPAVLWVFEEVWDFKGTKQFQRLPN